MKCLYCNAPRECNDHTIMGAGKKHNNVGATVPSCIMCNSILAANPDDSVRNRAEYVYARYRKWIIDTTPRKITREEIARRMEWIKDKWL